MRRAIILPCLLASFAATGCATKKYVSREVGEVNQKVDALSTEVEKTQERVQRSEVRLDEVDKSAQSGISEAKGSAAQAMTKATEAERAAKGKIIYTVTLSNDKVTFPVNRSEVSDDAKLLVDEAIAQLKAENKGVYFEIEGHTDASGPEEYNQKLGEDRAMAVRNYLHDQHGIALNRMQVISYGEAKPVVDNKTKDSRAQNRRVVIKVLE
ncbi:MAG TPA: OmpA family protein [Vicinamibacteria bacterium]|nr:OmpA family protein [Vicinamibacteria bacterium]